tara:strand:+ start:406 stop:957 length:552 start_codon:yes stop_codon:yes gene_type:complete
MDNMENKENKTRWTESLDALNDLNNIRDFLKNRNLLDEPCKKGSKYTIGDIVEDFAYLVDKSIRAKVDQSITTKKNKAYRNTKDYLRAKYDERDEEIRTKEFKSKYTCITPYRVTFAIWREEVFDEGDGWIYNESYPYETDAGGYVEFEHRFADCYNDPCWQPFWDYAKTLTIDDLEQSDIHL